MNTKHTPPRSFPLHENKDFLSESEWVIFKLLCRSVDTFATSEAAELSTVTGSQVTPERCDELIRTVRISKMPGLGTWIARLFAQAGLSERDVLKLPSASIAERVNDKLGYPLCNAATTEAIAQLQTQWVETNTLHLNESV